MRGAEQISGLRPNPQTMDTDNKLEDDKELSFRRGMKRLARDKISRADILFGTPPGPFVLGTSLVYHSLHPTALFFDEAGMCESDLLLIIACYSTGALIFSGPKQLGPTVLSASEENIFYRLEMGVSLLTRMVINDIRGYTLKHQHGHAGNIHMLSNKLFYEGPTRWQKGQVIDPDVWVSRGR